MNGPKFSNNPNVKNAKVLVVEDNDDQWILIQQSMRQSFAEVTVQRVATTDQALALLRDWQWQEWELPKLILLDLYLPNNADGWQLLQQIKSMTAPVRRIPVVMLTSSVTSADIEASYKLGAAAYMVKPLSFDAWLTCFRELRTYWWETVTLPPIQYGFN